MNELTAVVIGATGLTGNLLVQELLKDGAFKTVRVIVRKPVKIIHPKLEQAIVNFDDITDYTDKFGEGDMIFCCIGTTKKNVKNDKIVYEKIDFDIPVNAAKIGISKKYKKYLIISAIGANENSANFYLKLKGKTENALKQFPFESISIFHPSILIGERKEFRLGEKIIQLIAEIFSFLFFGFLGKYHSIDAKNVAKAMVAQSKINEPGIHTFEYAEMMSLAQN